MLTMNYFWLMVIGGAIWNVSWWTNVYFSRKTMKAKDGLLDAQRELIKHTQEAHEASKGYADVLELKSKLQEKQISILKDTIVVLKSYIKAIEGQNQEKNVKACYGGYTTTDDMCVDCDDRVECMDKTKADIGEVNNG